MKEASALSAPDLLLEWNEKHIEELRAHQKVSPLYGFLRETLPDFFTFRVPENWRVGHEIYVLAEKLKT